ncbi:hypothetical protein DFS34DRAFT_601951 [Phlyctochytrium arcticum]|nr:hypothetical protein DFS34DRAFT_601951 [Phlyctochytrium arcticum]
MASTTTATGSESESTLNMNNDAATMDQPAPAENENIPLPPPSPDSPSRPSISHRVSFASLQRDSDKKWQVEDSTLKKQSMYSKTVTSHIVGKPLFILWLVTGAIVTLYTLMYLGANWDPQSRIPHIPIAILNDDQGFPQGTPPQITGLTGGTNSAGALVESSLLTNDLLKNRIGWQSISAKGLTHDQAIQQVDDGTFWGIVYIPANFSAHFASNVLISGAPAQQQPQPLSIEYIWDQGRQFSTSSMALQTVTGSLQALSTSFASGLVRNLPPQTSLAPSYLISPFTLVNARRHAVPNYGVNFATYILPLVLWIGSIMTTTVIHKLYLARIPHLTGSIPSPALPPARFAPSRIVLSSLGVSLLFALINSSLAFCVLLGLSHGDTTLFSSPAGSPLQIFLFCFFLSLVFISITSLLSSLFTVDGFAVPASLLLIFQLTSSGAIIDHITMPGGLRVGYAFPFYWAIKILKAYFFESMVHEVPLAYGILLVWGLVSTVVTLFLATRKVSTWQSQIGKDMETSMQVLGSATRAL